METEGSQEPVIADGGSQVLRNAGILHHFMALQTRGPRL